MKSPEAEVTFFVNINICEALKSLINEIMAVRAQGTYLSVVGTLLHKIFELFNVNIFRFQVEQCLRKYEYDNITV